uniref:Uncharacterized protein n=1 Tax=Arundo donax TaxID=35708 RepID=A0A0A9H2V7_ARUDO
MRCVWLCSWQSRKELSWG